MLRLASLLVVFAACGGSGFDTGPAMLTGITPTIMSSGANSFTQNDANGMMVMGWTLFFFSANVGADCLSTDVKTIASVGIFTNQTQTATQKKATLATGDVVITAMSPPLVQGSAAATMGVMGLMNNIVGTITITTFALKADGTPEQIAGSLDAGGSDANGNPVSITGTFMAPVCE